MTTPYALDMRAVNSNLPSDFPLPASYWAEHFGVDVRTIREWTDKYSIPFYLPGRERFIKPTDFMACIPYVQPGKSPPVEE